MPQITKQRENFNLERVVMVTLQNACGDNFFCHTHNPDSAQPKYVYSYEFGEPPANARKALRINPSKRGTDRNGFAS